ncbi:MAG: hypothetical protein ACI4UN_05425 [Muribaculaceae bacterium]
MKPKFILLPFLCALCGFASHIHAEDSYKSVVVTTASGNVMKFDLSGGVDVSFSAENMIVTASSSQISLPITDFARFDFSTESASAQPTLSPNAIVRVSDGTISLSGLSPRSQVMLSTIGGIIIANGYCDESGSFTSSALTTGIYILKTDISTLKISIK